jgi:hypothetical protein
VLLLLAVAAAAVRAVAAPILLLLVEEVVRGGCEAEGDVADHRRMMLSVLPLAIREESRATALTVPP